MITKHNGFTLLEVLISSAILVVVLLTLYSSFFAGVSGRRDIENNLEVYSAARYILGRINLDLRNSFFFSESTSAFKGSNTGMEFFTLVDSYSADKLIPSYAFVSYAQEQDKLMRLERINKDALFNASQKAPDEIFYSIGSINFSYCAMQSEGVLGPPQDSWGQEKEQAGKLPACVNVLLTIGDKQFRRAVYLPLAIK